VQDQEAALDVPGGVGREVAERAVDRDCSECWCAGLRQLDRDRAAETIAEHGEPRRIGHRVLPQHVEARLGARA
jgi:hypothetical protein